MNTNVLERIILSAMLNDRDFSRKVIPHIKPLYFSSPEAAQITNLLLEYNQEYNNIPTKDTLEVELENSKGVGQDVYKNAKSLIGKLYNDEIKESIKSIDKDWLLNKTEAHFKQQSCYHAVLDSLSIIEGENKKKTVESIPSILEEAVNISFDTDVGHDYFEDAQERYEYYHRTDTKIPFHLNAMNIVTNGGAAIKSLIVPVAPTGVGKSFFMTAWSAWLIKNGYDVLYVTLEMAEEKIGERIDANLMNLTINELGTCPENVFNNKINSIARQATGKLIIKEYPSANFSALNLKALLDELEAKKGFKPTVVMLDYLNLASSYRIPKGTDTYLSVKYAAEELRSVAMEYGIIMCAPTQTNREGVGASDYDMTQISESMGIAHTSDFIFGLIETQELAENSQLKIKQLKNRWGDINRPSAFVISVNKAKMQMHDYDDISSYTKAFELKGNSDAPAEDDLFAEPIIKKESPLKQKSKLSW